MSEAKTVLVTGGSGFIGASTCLRLVDEGYNVVNIDRRKRELPGVTQYPFELDNHQVRGLIKLLQPEAIIHLAASHTVEGSMTDPGTYYWNNVANTISLLNHAVDAGVKKFVFSSSSSVYGDNMNSAQVGAEEDNTTKAPISPYAKSKSITEDILWDYATAHDLQSVSLRYFNAAGSDTKNNIGYVTAKDELPTHLIPVLCKAVNESETFTVFGDTHATKDGTTSRDYTHVMDIVEGHVKALEYLNAGGNTDIFNMGASNTHTILEVIECFETVTGKKVDYKVGGERAGDVNITFANNTKAAEILDWHPTRDLNTIIEDAWAWETRKKK
jgi:UDP-glucose 4-epimerase